MIEETADKQHKVTEHITLTVSSHSVRADIRPSQAHISSRDHTARATDSEHVASRNNSSIGGGTGNTGRLVNTAMLQHQRQSKSVEQPRTIEPAGDFEQEEEGHAGSSTSRSPPVRGSRDLPPPLPLLLLMLLPRPAVEPRLSAEPDPPIRDPTLTSQQCSLSFFFPSPLLLPASRVPSVLLAALTLSSIPHFFTTFTKIIVL
jgi:hypothetical protein